MIRIKKFLPKIIINLKLCFGTRNDGYIQNAIRVTY